MEDERPPPGPEAARAYRLGMITGAIVGLLTVGALYWAGVLTPLALGYVVVALFPVYLIVVAVILSVWLGYDKDATSLRPVYKAK
jgi:Na+/proline symporter